MAEPEETVAAGEWVPAFPGQRPPFQPGHELSLKHGAYASVALGPRVAELADELRPHVPGYTPADEIALRILCLGLARLERSAAAVDDADPAALERLRQDERGWSNTVRRFLSELGMTPRSRAQLGLDIARTGDELQRYLERREQAQIEPDEPSGEDES